MDHDGTLELARAARRLVVKTGSEIVRLDRAARPVSDAELLGLLLHEDGLLRVPVLILGDLLVRGFTDDLYREALGSP